MWAEHAFKKLRTIAGLRVEMGALLKDYTRFGLGGPASVFAETDDETAFMTALQFARDSGADYVVLGGGTNLVVSDLGYDGIVLRYIATAMRAEHTTVWVDAGAELNHLVDFLNNAGLSGLETLAGIPGWVGAAVYGNAGAYGHSMQERARQVRFFDGAGIRSLDNSGCEFRYRESIFKRNKDWIIFAIELAMSTGDIAALRKISADIRKVRDEKFPPTMKCAGSIFKNFLMKEIPQTVQREVPEKVVREGKIPAAYFLEQVGAKGLVDGGIHVADYHANLIYNDGTGTAVQLCRVIDDLKQRIATRYGMPLEEEVQYVGFGATRRAG